MVHIRLIGKEVTQEAERVGRSVYDLLDSQAAAIAPGSDGCIVLEHWQGNRTPWTDPLSRGVIRGLTLSHTPAHIYRAIMEGVAYGTEVIFRKMKQEGVHIDRLVACGGATQSDLWMKIMTDVGGIPITIPREQQATTLGSAIGATVAGGLHPDLVTAAGCMVGVEKVVEPDMGAHARYAGLVDQYTETYECLKEASHRLVKSMS